MACRLYESRMIRDYCTDCDIGQPQKSSEDFESIGGSKQASNLKRTDTDNMKVVNNNDRHISYKTATRLEIFNGFSWTGMLRPAVVTPQVYFDVCHVAQTLAAKPCGCIDEAGDGAGQHRRTRLCAHGTTTHKHQTLLGYVCASQPGYTSMAG